MSLVWHRDLSVACKIDKAAWKLLSISVQNKKLFTHIQLPLVNRTIALGPKTPEIIALAQIQQNNL